MTKELTVPAYELLQDEQMEFFTCIETYTKWLMIKTDFKNAMIMLKALDREIDGTVYATDKVYFVADDNNIYLNVDDYFEQLGFEDTIWI